MKDSEIKEVFQRMSIAVNQPKDLEGKFEALLRVILNYTNLKIAEGWIMNIDNSRLNKAASSTKAFDFDNVSELKAISKEVEIGIDLPGTVWERGEIIIWEDLENHPEFAQNKSMLKYGLKTAVGIPIYHDNTMVGVITLFSQESITQVKYHLKFFEKINLGLGAELKRMKTEDELKSIFDLTPNLLFVIDSNGIIKKGNLQTAITLDCFSVDLTGKSFREMVPEDYQSKFDDLLINIDKKRSIVEIDIPILIKDQLIWINLTASLLPSGFFIYCVGKDISHQKNLEDLLKRAHQIVRMGTWEMNLVNNKVYWSPMVKVIHELDEQFEPDLHKAIAFYKEGYSKDLVQEKVALAMKGEINDFDIDVELVTSKGVELWVRVQAESEWINGKMFRIYGSVQDITERKNIESELAEANIRYDLAYRGNNMGIWDWNIKDDVLTWDDNMKILYGLEKDTVVNAFQFWKKGLHPDDLEEQNNLVQKIMAGQNDYNTKFRIVRPVSGEIRYIKAMGYVVRNKTGEPIRIVGINYDVTEEVISKIELQKANHEIEDILGSITDGFFSVDKDWIVTYWNNAAEKILQKPREKIVGENLGDIYQDALHLAFFTEFSISMDKKEERFFVEFYPTIGIWLECSTFPKENGIVVYLKNITARIEQQQNLAEVRLLQEHVINSTEDLIWAMDDQYKLIIANNAFLKEMLLITGIDCKLGEHLINFSEEKIFNFWTEIFSKVFKGEQQNITFEAKGKLSSPKTFQIGMYPIIDKQSGEDKITGAACFCRDITDKVNHIKAIEKQNEKLRDIAWRQSHIVRAPVARIMGLVNLQKNMNYSGEKLEEILNYIMDSTEELDQIIRDISKRSYNQ
ncbi:putative sensor/response regulator hybrid [Cyclobacterium qasimii M12-11B]|uniref:histidine kinase n=1 Tax=Cyclobacterium qasimii M12-11B TaxID=641524 RepID=S7VDM5_9BACT|nr:putative sensor/response regulator hybrid [Cyclobacterium qasimii M12-11B]